MELTEVIKVLNKIKTRELEARANYDKGITEILEIIATPEEIQIENMLVGSMFLEEMASYEIVTFLMDCSYFKVPENENIFAMVRIIFGWSGAINYENLSMELTNRKLLNEKMKLHLQMLKTTYLDKEMRMALRERIKHTIIYTSE